MNEAIDMAQLLHDTPDLFPWVVLAIVIFVLYKERSTIKELVQSIIQSRKDTTVFYAQQNELIRNNTAALENKENIAIVVDRTDN